MKIVEAGILEAKTHFSEFIENVERGDVTYLITKRGKKVAELRPVDAIKPRLLAGEGKGSVLYIAEDFDAPLEEMKEYME